MGEQRKTDGTDRSEHPATAIDLDRRPGSYWPNGVPSRPESDPPDPDEVNELDFDPCYSTVIATVSYCSTLGNSVQLYAVPDGERIRYHALHDEYGKRRVATAISDRPLTLGELIDQIDETEADPPLGLVFGPLYSNWWNDATVDELRDFVQVTSDLYPEIEAYYEKLCSTWLDEQIAEREKMSGEGDEDEEDD